MKRYIILGFTLFLLPLSSYYLLNHSSFLLNLRSRTNIVQAQTTSYDWPQVGNNPQHTGYSPETLGTNFKVKWTKAFQPDKVHPQTQAIVAGGVIFVGTEGANGLKPTMYAFDAATGTIKWTFIAGGPILNSAAVNNGIVYFGSLDGAIYALNASNGNQVWKKQLIDDLGFFAAPIVSDNKVLIGGQDGIFYGLDFSDGSVLWSYNVNSPILQTAAFDSGKVVFGTMDNYVYAINTSNGSLAWKSQQIPDGSGFLGQYPVIYQNKIFIRPLAREGWHETSFANIGFPLSATWEASHPNWNWITQNSAAVAAGNATQTSNFISVQNTGINNYLANPSAYKKNFYVFDLNTGQEPYVVPHTANQTMGGVTAPPCVDRDGYLVNPVLFIRSAWGRLDLNYGGTGTTPRIVDILYDGLDYNGQPVGPSSGSPKGSGNPDENLNVTCTANMIIAMHIMEMNANYTGFFDLNTRKWTQISAGARNLQMFDCNEGGSPGVNPATISNGMVFHISMDELVARTTQ